MKNKFNQMNKEDLKKILEEKVEAVRNIRFGVAGGKSKNVKAEKTLKKDIARILTTMNSKIENYNQ